MIRQLPAGYALVIRGGYAPVIARLPRAWNNYLYHRARRTTPPPFTQLTDARAASPWRLPPSGRPQLAIPDHVPDDLPGADDTDRRA
jgi:hypothetical protein